MTFAKTIEISAESPNGFDEAIREGIQRANESLEHVEGAWVKDQEVVLDDGAVKAYRVHLKVTFTTKH